MDLNLGETDERQEDFGSTSEPTGVSAGVKPKIFSLGKGITIRWSDSQPLGDRDRDKGEERRMEKMETQRLMEEGALGGRKGKVKLCASVLNLTIFDFNKYKKDLRFFNTIVLICYIFHDYDFN